MKLTDFFDQTQILEEGIRFTNREMNYVKKNAKNIYVAFEYEFNPIIEKMEAIKQGESPKEDTPEPEREVISIDDIYEYEEYTERQSELEQEAFDEEFERRGESFKEEKREEFENNYSESIDMVGELGIQSNFMSKNAYRNFLEIDSNNFNILLESLIDDELNNDGVIKFIRYMEIIRNFIKDYNESGLSAVVSGIYYDDVSDFAEELSPHIDSRGTQLSRLFEIFEDTEEFSTIQEFLQEVSDLEIPDFSDFSDREQIPLYFKEYNKEAKKVAEQFEEIGLTGEGIKTITGFLDTVFWVGADLNQYIKNAIDRYVDSEWEDEETTVREETWEWVWNYSDVRDSIDVEEVILDIQRNHFVVVVNYDDEVYFPPSDGSFTGSRAGRSSDNHETYTTNFIKEYGHKWNISFDRDFEREVDIEGHGMLEYKSHPKPLNDALELMHNMFDMINDIGTTSTGHAGVHTNMSLKNIKMGKKNFNPLKLVIMSDNELIHELFPERTHVANVFRELGDKQLYDIAAADKSDIIPMFDDIIPKGAKFQGINFSHLDVYAEDLRRIEFRYTGGKDYSERGKLMEWTVHRFAYALMAAFDDKFMQKEYLKEIVKVLDKHVKKSFPNQFKSFVEMRNFITKNRIRSYDEFQDKNLEDITSSMKHDWTIINVDKGSRDESIWLHVKDASFPINLWNDSGKSWINRDEYYEDTEVLEVIKNKTRTDILKYMKRKYKS